MRGLYVSLDNTSLPEPFVSLLYQPANQDQFFKFIQAHDITTLNLYDLGKVLSTIAWAALLPSFMQTLRKLGVLAINAVASSLEGFEAIRTYQLAQTGAESQFDGLLTEIEFWNKYSPANDSAYTKAFEEFIALLQEVRALKITHQSMNDSLPVMAYLGWLRPSKLYSQSKQAELLARNLDVIYLHAYVKDPTTAWNYVEGRVRAFASTRLPLKIWFILSAEGIERNDGGHFMGDWLKDPANGGDSVSMAESIVLKQVQENRLFNVDMAFMGFQWFTYYYLDHSMRVS
ncbi:hypothetical protein BJ741DRAFT_618773 [Chytriomyces cf. hyalinus JEL632]|nr:hypothetical protein BJ741DRAFT_618773 [Chytriomyces cf. hyalinus JEL632]